MTDNEGILLKELKDRFGYENFKSDLQRRAVLAVYGGTQNVFVSMPTGSGKSLCYQLPALLFRGITLVLSPLIALIEDQVQQLKAKGINAVALNSKTSNLERKSILKDLHHKTPDIKLLYVTPELVSTAHFRSVLETLYKLKKISLIAVDEAHCVSEWGHDFRPDYLKLGELRGAFSLTPWLALTATATPHVQSDVISSLQMKHTVSVFKATCFRPNLFYDVKYKDTLRDPLEDLREFVSMALELPAKATSTLHGRVTHKGCGIVYCRTRDGCNMLAGRLTSKGIKAKAYHAGLQGSDRSKVQQEWMDGVVPVIVATISFGMGVDKADVRFVAHWTIPKSVEGYYQESGRAGRDGQPSYCRMYYSKSDRDDLVFLIKLEAKKKKKSKGYSANGLGTVKEATQKSFEAMVKYCEEAQCRHTAIAEYFKDPKPQCKKSCDYCKNPAATKEHTKNGKFLSVSKKSGAYGSVSGSYGIPDPSLYGGGRWGNKDEESDSSGGEDGDGDGRQRRKRKLEDRVRLFEEDFFEAEFRKRRKVSSERESEVPDSSCKLREAANFSRIPKLALKVREHCLGILTQALEENVSGMAGHSDFPEVAVDMEYDIFRSKKVPQSYKLGFNNKIKEIKSFTKDKKLHPSFERKEKSLGSASSSTGSEVIPLPSCPGFVKASEVVSTEHLANEARSHKPPLTSFVAASQLLPLTEAGVGPGDSTNGLSPMETCCSSKSRVEEKLVGGVEKAAGGRGGVETVASDSKSHGVIGEVEKATGGRGGSEKAKGGRGGSEKAKGGSSGVQAQGGSSGVEKAKGGSKREKVVGNTEGELQETTSTLSSTTTAKTNALPTNCTALQVIASKNSLLGLDLHEPSTSVAPTRKRNRSPKRRKNMSPAKRRKSSPTRRNASSARQNASPKCSGSPVAPVSHATPKHNKERKLVADAVVQALSSYYKQKRIASKGLFKKFAKSLAERLMLCSSHFDADNLEQKVGSILQEYFTEFGQVATEEDMQNLEHLF